MISSDTELTLAELVTRQPAAARVLERFGLDYCCGGKQTLGDACSTADVDASTVLGEIEALGAGPEPDWASMSIADLVDHLETTHHAYLHAEMPRLSALAEKVATVHGERHPELAKVAAVYAELRADLDPHLRKEEMVLFPMIRAMAAADTAPQFHCGSLGNPITVMLAEHDATGDLLAELRSAAGDYVTPADGCASYRALYDGLAELEHDTHLHVHKENNLLFPAVLELERKLLQHRA
jgi:regulator of cell morphogenesis and NO signaling